MDRFQKLSVYLLIILPITISYEIYDTLAIPASNRNSIVTPGGQTTPCTWDVFIDGSNFDARNCQTGDIGFKETTFIALWSDIIATNEEIFLEVGTYNIPLTSQASPLAMTFKTNVTLIGQDRDGTVLNFVQNWGAGAVGAYTVMQNLNTGIASGGDSGIDIESLTITGFWVGTVTAWLQISFYGVHRSMMRNVVTNKIGIQWRIPIDWTGASWAAQNVYTTPTNVLAFDNTFSDSIFNQCASVQAGLYRSTQIRNKYLQCFDDSVLAGSWSKQLYFAYDDFDAAGINGAYGAATAHINLLNDNSTGFGQDPTIIEAWVSHCNFRNANQWVSGERAGIAVQGATLHSDHNLFEFNRQEGIYVTHGILDSTADVMQSNDGLGVHFVQDTLIPSKMSGKYGGTKFLPLSHISSAILRDNYQVGTLTYQGLVQKGALGYLNSAATGNQNLGGIVIDGNCQFIDDQAVATQVNGIEISIAAGTTYLNGGFITIRQNDFSQQPTSQIVVRGNTAGPTIQSIEQNQNYNPIGIVANFVENTGNTANPISGTTTPSSATTYTVKITPMQLIIIGGTVTAIIVNGKTIATVATTEVIELRLGDTFSVTFSVAPTWQSQFR